MIDSPPVSRSVEKKTFVCGECRFRSSKWLGRCPGCGEWNRFEETRQSSSRIDAGGTASVPYSSIQRQDVERIQTHNPEFDRVLGGGIVPGSVVMLGGEPGIGKSTLLLQIADSLSGHGRQVLYVAGEESAHQIKMRGERLGVRGEGLLLASETALENVLAEVHSNRPDLLIVDSIQTLRSHALDSLPGSVSQIKECADRLLAFAKQTGVPVFLIGHITKDGSLAGPKTLEHVVDVVLYFEGDTYHQQKIVRAVKNRFGAANEIGLFEMTATGLVCVDSPSQFFLSERATRQAGSAVVCTVEGSRPVLVELQALVSQSNYSTSRRMSNGVDRNRLNLLLAMLEKRLGLNLIGSDVYVNVAGGLTLTEPAVDLALVAAILSSYRDQPLSDSAVIFGEVGLVGEVRATSFAHSRVKEAAAMGFQRVILPQGNVPLGEQPPDIELSPVASVKSGLDLLF